MGGEHREGTNSRQTNVKIFQQPNIPSKQTGTERQTYFPLWEAIDLTILHLYWEAFLFPCHSQIITSAHLFCVSMDSSCSHPARRQKHDSSTGGIPSLEPGWKVIATCTLLVVLASLGWQGCQHLLVKNYSSRTRSMPGSTTLTYIDDACPSSAVGKLIILI